METIEVFVIEDNEVEEVDFDLYKPVLCDAFWREVTELHNKVKVEELEKFASLLEESAKSDKQKVADALKKVDALREFDIAADDVDQLVKSQRAIADAAAGADACMSRGDLDSLIYDADSIEQYLSDGSDWADTFLELAGNREYSFSDLCTYVELFRMVQERKKKSFRAMREAVGASQADVAEELGVNVRSVKRWESWNWDHVAPDNACAVLDAWKKDQAAVASEYIDVDNYYSIMGMGYPEKPQTLNEYLREYVGVTLSYYRDQDEYDAAVERGEEKPGVQYWRHNAKVREHVILMEAVGEPYTVELKPMVDPFGLDSSDEFSWDGIYRHNYANVMERLD